MNCHQKFWSEHTGTLGAAACLGDEKYHVERGQFAPEPQLSRAEWISSLSGTRATLNYSGNWITTKLG
jgi:hypothetical protein